MISKKTRKQILTEYDEKKATIEEYCQELVQLAEKLCQHDRQLIHSMSGRVKNRQSLEGKLLRPEKQYGKLSDITDIAGVRIITHYGRDVDRIAETIRREFVIDGKNSVDKRDLLDSDRFGYLSLHLIATLSADRLALAEYAQFRGYQVEIQIRSILQHAWAEITHDLDYKSSVAVPREARRAFFRVAGLLELADHEFGRVRDALTDYRAAVPTLITREPSAVYIDQDSLIEFARSSLFVQQVDQDMANAAAVDGLMQDPRWMKKYVAHLEFFRVRTIKELSEALARHRQFLIDYSAARLRKMSYARLISGVSIAYLFYALAAEPGGEAGVFEYFKRFGLYTDDATRQEIAALVVKLNTDRKQKRRGLQ
jgi:ppGpp synthetase/RelA/SpoT-type nucleotidyltranferase